MSLLGDSAVSITPKPDVLFHANLYTFVTKYLVNSLRQQCVRSLDWDLCEFSLNKESAPQILNLLDFTYADTRRANPGGAPSLHNLVIHYVACKRSTLADNERFDQLLISTGEMGSDLVAKLP